jgi:hypothetical protein
MCGIQGYHYGIDVGVSVQMLFLRWTRQVNVGLAGDVQMKKESKAVFENAEVFRMAKRCWRELTINGSLGKDNARGPRSSQLERRK